MVKLCLVAMMCKDVVYAIMVYIVTKVEFQHKMTDMKRNCGGKGACSS